MRIRTISAAAVLIGAISAAKPAKAYDIDCAIILCMAGGFPPSAVCSAAYAEMIRRITPKPVLPPFGPCTYAAAPVALGGTGRKEMLDISKPDYAWLRRTRVIWWTGRQYENRDGELRWNWSVSSCDHTNLFCRVVSNGYRSKEPWPDTFTTENGQTVKAPSAGAARFYSSRSVMMEFSDYEGVMNHSGWSDY